MDINDVFIKCVEKWTENEFDDRVSLAMDRFNDWIKNFDEEEKDILCKILEKFNCKRKIASTCSKSSDVR